MNKKYKVYSRSYIPYIDKSTAKKIKYFYSRILEFLLPYIKNGWTLKVISCLLTVFYFYEAMAVS